MRPEIRHVGASGAKIFQVILKKKKEQLCLTTVKFVNLARARLRNLENPSESKEPPQNEERDNGSHCLAYDILVSEKIW